MSEDGAPVHSPRSPSGYHRWAHCLDAAHAEAGYPDDTSPWAAEGTLFHTIIANLLTKPVLDASDYRDEERTIDGHDVKCDDDMVKYLYEGVDFISELPGRLFVEKKVTLDRWMPGEWGTTDVGLVQTYGSIFVYCSCLGEMIPQEEYYSQCCEGFVGRTSTGRITICDWKYGNEPVYAERNEQLMLYALGFWNWIVNRFDGYEGITDIRLVIRQPRVGDYGNHSSWDLTLEELLAFGQEAAEKHRLSRLPGNPRSPGKKTCRWCKAKQGCKPYNDYVLDIIGAKLDPIGLGSMSFETPKYLTPEQRAHILTNWPMISKWHKALSQDALNDGVKGLPTPGQKVIVGRRGDRKWTDVDAAKLRLTELLGDKAVVEKIVTPTEAEKLLTKAEYKVVLATLISQDEGKPVLVAEDEKGLPYVSYEDKLQAMAADAGSKI